MASGTSSSRGRGSPGTLLQHSSASREEPIIPIWFAASKGRCPGHAIATGRKQPARPARMARSQHAQRPSLSPQRRRSLRLSPVLGLEPGGCKADAGSQLPWCAEPQADTPPDAARVFGKPLARPPLQNSSSIDQPGDRSQCNQNVLKLAPLPAPSLRQTPPSPDRQPVPVRSGAGHRARPLGSLPGCGQQPPPKPRRYASNPAPRNAPCERRGAERPSLGKPQGPTHTGEPHWRCNDTGPSSAREKPAPCAESGSN